MNPSSLCISFKPNSSGGKFALESLSKYLEQCKCESKSDVINAIENLVGASLFTLATLEDAEKTVLQ